MRLVYTIVEYKIALPRRISGVQNGVCNIDSTNLKISENFVIIIIESERGSNYEFKLLEIRIDVGKRLWSSL